MLLTEMRKQLETFGKDVVDELEKRVMNNSISEETTNMDEKADVTSTDSEKAIPVNAELVSMDEKADVTSTNSEDVSQKCNLKVTDKCMKCGSCLGCGLSFLSSSPDGEIIVQPGTVLAESDDVFKTLKDICPVDAFELEVEKDESAVINELIQELKNFSGLKIPSIKTLKFECEEYEVPVPSVKGEYQYTYKSERAAELAARNEFDRVMYSQKNTIILRLITEYRVKKISPYYTYEEAEGSLYVKKIGSYRVF